MNTPKWTSLNKNCPVILGAPMDMTVTNRSGARMGPSAVRQASFMLCDGDHYQSRIDPISELQVRDGGDIAVAYTNVEKSLLNIEQKVSEVLKVDCVPMTIGGDHTVTLPILRALHKKYGKMALVHFDAHIDTWPISENNPVGHGSFLRAAIDEGLVDPFCTYQFGVRSPVPKDVTDWTKKQGVMTYSSVNLHTDNRFLKISEIVNCIKDMPIYFTFDIDCLDPCQAPGTGTPEIGGLQTWQIQYILNNIYRTNIVGCDVVEIAPAYDHAEITSLAGATIMWEFLNMVYRGSK
jgi:agmatinase